jgi:SnoaL-like domain
MSPLKWIPTLFASIDAKDTSRFLSFLSDDACFRFANLPAAIGQDAIREAIDGFFASIAACRHDVSNVWAPDGNVICEGHVTYTRLNGSVLSVPFVNVFGMVGPLIREYSIYVDASALFSAPTSPDAAPTRALGSNGTASRRE